MAVILAEPSLKLRRANGQVKVRFTNTNNTLDPTTADIKVGDEILLGLQGVVAEQKRPAEDPERGVELELHYTKGVTVRVIRNAVSLNTAANADMV
jgi:hypothetical protein